MQNAENAFSALFIHEKSYIKVLQKANFHFGLHLLSHNRELPLVKTAYMKLSDKIIPNPGKNGNVSILELIYSKSLKLLICIAKLKTNFTCMKIPYIILAGSGEEHMIYGLITGKYDNLGGLIRHDIDFKLKGKIGNAIDNQRNEKNESVSDIIKEDRQSKKYEVQNDIKHDLIMPSATAVEIPPELNKYFMNREKNMKSQLEKNGITADVTTMEGYIRPEVQETVERAPVKSFTIQGEVTNKTANTTSNLDNDEPETWQGFKVMKGARGGKYVLKGGKKKYIKNSGYSKTSKSGIIYKVRLSDGSN